MKFWKKNDGLTLIELMISIAIGTMIFAAATTVLLLGIRINHHTTDSIMQQYTARTVISMMEQMAEEGSVNKTYRAPDGSWKLGTKIPDDDDQAEDAFENVVLSYSSEAQTIYTGDGVTPILENVIASYIILEGNVLTISLEDTEGTYSSSVYCRIQGMIGGENFDSADHGSSIIKPPDENKSDNEQKEQEARESFLLLLNSQVGIRGGIIDHSKEPGNQIIEDGEVTEIKIVCNCKNYNFYSEWFLGGYNESTSEKGWGPDTPWCACFVSWGLVNSGLSGPSGNSKWYANVDSFMKYFKTRSTEKNCWAAVDPADETPYIPKPADLIFFDMVGGSRNDPSHMGTVLSVANGKVTTIEGNSADMVAIREYDLKDSRILGYGDPWAAQGNS